MIKRHDAPAFAKFECSPEVIALVKLLAELNGFDLVDKTGTEVQAESSDFGRAPRRLLAARRAPAQTLEASHPLPLERVRDLYVKRVLEMCRGNRARAAQMLGIGRSSLYRILKRMGATEEMVTETQGQGDRMPLTFFSDPRQT